MFTRVRPFVVPGALAGSRQRLQSRRCVPGCERYVQNTFNPSPRPKLSWAGVSAARGEATVTPAAIIAASLALTVVVGAQANAFTTINAAARDRTGWPLAVTADFRDGTVLEGDNDWSVRDRQPGAPGFGGATGDRVA